VVDQSFSVLHLFSYHLYTGPAEPILTLARAQLEAGYNVRLAIDTLREGDLVERAKQFGVPIDKRFALSVKAGPILHMRDVLVFKRLWAAQEFDILHAHRSHEHTLAALARPRKSRPGRTKLIRTLHTERAISKNRKWQLRRADGLVTIAQKFSQELIERGVLPDELIVNVSGAVDCDRFYPDSNDLTLRKELGIGPDTPLVGIVARMKSDRGHASLLTAWEKVSAHMPDARLVIAGRGELEQELKDRVAGSALSGSVTFLGYRTDLPELYRGLDLKVLLAPGNDGTCRAVLEAMASGVPVLATETGALSEIVADGQTGRLVARNDPDALAAALVELLSNPESLKKMGVRARRQAEETHTIEKQFRKIDQLYKQITR